jgi:hypothetical protein
MHKENEAEVRRLLNLPKWDDQHKEVPLPPEAVLLIETAEKMLQQRGKQRDLRSDILALAAAVGLRFQAMKTLERADIETRKQEAARG